MAGALIATNTDGRTRAVGPFHQTILKHGLSLRRGKTATLQVNVGLLCNQSCRHCHLGAGPDRDEIMDKATVDDVIAYAGRCGFDVIDITGGAPELNPNIERLLEGISSLAPRLVFRSNLSALHDGGCDHIIKLLREKRYVIVASFPSVNEAQTEGQRGSGIFRKSIAALQGLNAIGYGHEGSGLELDLVANPTGAFLPSPQKGLERRFKEVLLTRWGIVFNRLFSFANVPLGRFMEWL